MSHTTLDINEVLRRQRRLMHNNKVLRWQRRLMHNNLVVHQLRRLTYYNTGCLVKNEAYPTTYHNHRLRLTAESAG
jgi:hypothetical protein